MHGREGVRGVIVYVLVKQWEDGAKWAQRGLDCLRVSRGAAYLQKTRFQAFVVDLKSFFRPLHTVFNRVTYLIQNIGPDAVRLI